MAKKEATMKKRASKKAAPKRAVRKAAYPWKYERDLRELAAAYLLEALGYATSETNIAKAMATPVKMLELLHSNNKLQGPERDRARVALGMLSHLAD